MNDVHPIFAPLIDSLRGHAETLGEVGRLKAIIRNMKCVLELCEEYFDNRADVVDGSYGIPEPNKEMALLTEVRDALKGCGHD